MTRKQQTTAAPPPACLLCGAGLPNEEQKYCPDCLHSRKQLVVRDGKPEVKA